jgi:uncharacterized protein YggE
MTKLFWVVSLILLNALAVADNQARTVTVNGTGTAAVLPDKATIMMSIVAQAADLATAQDRAAEVTGDVLDMTDSMDIPRDKVSTTGASVRPDYHWNRDTGEQELRGYIAARQITVEIDDLGKLGEVVEGAVKAGVNQVTPPQLDSSSRKATYRVALQAAAEDARANAKKLAETLDTRLGQVISINAGSNVQQPPIPYRGANMAMAAESADAVQSYNPAELSISATVTVVFELVD